MGGGVTAVYDRAPRLKVCYCFFKFRVNARGCAPCHTAPCHIASARRSGPRRDVRGAVQIARFLMKVDLPPAFPGPLSLARAHASNLD